MAKRLSTLLLAVDPAASPCPAGGDPEVGGIQYDSRKVASGDLFVAVRGHRLDGHRFVPEAIARGAVAVVGEREEPASALPAGVPYITVEDSRRALAELACAFYDHPTRELFTVGVTGTKGKTSVAHLSAAALGEEGTELISTVVNALCWGLEQTTPEAPLIQRIAREARQTGKIHLVLETSAHALSLSRVQGVEFDVAVFTSLSHDHLDYFRDRARYLRAKLRLFRSLKPGAMAVINRDDPAAPQVIAATRAEVLTYGLGAGAEIRAEVLERGAWGTSALVRTPWGKTRLGVRFPGAAYLYNALAALGVGLVRGVPLFQIGDRLAAVRHIEGRLERHLARGGFTVVIDYAHSPASLEQVLETLRPYYRRIITVFGCGGSSDRAKRPAMGAIAARHSDYTIVTSDNPKGEAPEAIIQEIEGGIPPEAPYEAIVDRRRAIRRALALARPEDCLLIAGKGHERAQVFKDRLIPFNDRAYLAQLGVIAGPRGRGERAAG